MKTYVNELNGVTLEGPAEFCESLMEWGMVATDWSLRDGKLVGSRKWGVTKPHYVAESWRGSVTGYTRFRVHVRTKELALKIIKCIRQDMRDGECSHYKIDVYRHYSKRNKRSKFSVA